MESSNSEVSEVPDFIYVAGGQTYVATSQEEVSKIISSYERATIARFVVEHQSTKFSTEDWHGKKLFRWSLKSVPSAFGPAIVIGTKVLCCHQGKDRHLNFKKLKREQTRLKRMAKDQGIKEKDPTSRKSTKKVNCPAAIYIKKVAFFPDYQVTEATPHRKRMACKRFNQDRLKRPESIKVDVKFFVTLPDSKDHRNHLSGEDLFKKIMKNRTLYDPQASIPKKKKKKKSKKRKKRERKMKMAAMEIEEKEGLENMAFSFLPSTSTRGDASISEYRMDETEQLVSDKGQDVNSFEQVARPRLSVPQSFGSVGSSTHISAPSLSDPQHVAGTSISTPQSMDVTAGQRLHIARPSPCISVSQSLGVNAGESIHFAGPSMSVPGQRIDVAGHSVYVAGQSNHIAGQNVNVAVQGIDAVGQNLDVARQDLHVASQGLDVVGCNLGVAGNNLGVMGEDEDVLGQDLITVDRRQLLPMDHL
ncbi:uncharacterized protein LOC129254835 isoform X1 [Lytechinus pictus]|uniref:uncharacterized protein LOC129254835 isoform X1 n=1 Tax=Lytechinus pictus TaxID=7653 RepID=UPI0030B9BFA5